MVTSNLARSFFDGATNADVSMRGHDRYLIYRMLGRRVSFSNPRRRRGRAVVSGAVEDVARNIFSNEVELTISGKMFSFKEPAAIVRRGEAVVFLYGDIGKNVSDAAVFKEMKAATWSGETMQETFRKTERGVTKETEFLMGEEVGRKARRRKSR